MKKHITIFYVLVFVVNSMYSQSLYFPPNTGFWDTISPSSLNWCQSRIDSLQMTQKLLFY